MCVNSFGIKSPFHQLPGAPAACICKQFQPPFLRNRETCDYEIPDHKHAGPSLPHAGAHDSCGTNFKAGKTSRNEAHRPLSRTGRRRLRQSARSPSWPMCECGLRRQPGAQTPPHADTNSQEGVVTLSKPRMPKFSLTLFPTRLTGTSLRHMHLISWTINSTVLRGL